MEGALVRGASERAEDREIGVSLSTPETIRRLQRTLYVTAKQAPARRFHGLFDKVWRHDILAHAYALSRANGGAPGVDGETFADIEEYGEEISVTLVDGRRHDFFRVDESRLRAALSVAAT